MSRGDALTLCVTNDLHLVTTTGDCAYSSHIQSFPSHLDDVQTTAECIKKPLQGQKVETMLLGSISAGR